MDKVWLWLAVALLDSPRLVESVKVTDQVFVCAAEAELEALGLVPVAERLILSVSLWLTVDVALSLVAVLDSDRVWLLVRLRFVFDVALALRDCSELVEPVGVTESMCVCVDSCLVVMVGLVDCWE